MPPTTTSSQEATFEKFKKDIDEAEKVIKELCEKDEKTEAFEWYRELLETKKVAKRKCDNARSALKTGFVPQLHETFENWEKTEKDRLQSIEIREYRKLRYLTPVLRKIEKLLKEKGVIR